MNRAQVIALATAWVLITLAQLLCAYLGILGFFILVTTWHVWMVAAFVYGAIAAPYAWLISLLWRD